MWRLISYIILFLNTDIAAAYYVLTTSAIPWTDAQHICNVPYFNDIMYTEKDYTELANKFSAWTSSLSRTSDWASVYEFWTKSIKRSRTEGNRYNCLTKRQDGTFISNNCSSNNIIYCADGHRAYGTWSYAINLCIFRNKSLLKERNNSSDYWLGYFMYEEDEANQRCVAIQRNDITRPITYQFRSCSDHLPAVCTDDINSNYVSSPITVTNDSLLPTSTMESMIGRTINRPLDLCVNADQYIKITTGGAAFSGTIIIFLLVVIYIQRRKLIKASFTSLTARRDQNNYNDIPHQMSDSITGQYYEVSSLSEILASGGKPSVQQNIDILQHVDTSGYLIPSSMLDTSGDYQKIAD